MTSIRDQLAGGKSDYSLQPSRLCRIIAQAHPPAHRRWSLAGTVETGSSRAGRAQRSRSRPVARKAGPRTRNRGPTMTEPSPDGGKRPPDMLQRLSNLVPDQVFLSEDEMEALLGSEDLPVELEQLRRRVLDT